MLHKAIDILCHDKWVAVAAWAASLVIHKIRLPGFDTGLAEKLTTLLALSRFFDDLGANFADEYLVEVITNALRGGEMLLICIFFVIEPQVCL